MSSLEILKSIYKPYRLTINNSATIIESTSGKFVLKKQNKDLFELFNYLEARGFNNYPKLVHNFDNKDNVFEYIDDNFLIKEQKYIELAEVVASLHNKTVYFKNVKIDTFKKIYDDIKNNIEYEKNNFDIIFTNSLKEEYMMSDKYLFVRNYYKFISSLDYAEKNLDNWYEMVKEETKIRVSVVHNNLSFNHYLENQDKSVLISWDNYKIDTPVLDIYYLYQKEYLNYDFSLFLERYLEIFELLESEKKLLSILLAIPLQIDFKDNLFESTNYVKKIVEYVYSSEKIIKKLFT